MAKSNKRRKILIFGLIGAGVAGLAVWAILKKREVVITIQTERVSRRNLTEIVVALEFRFRLAQVRLGGLLPRA